MMSNSDNPPWVLALANKISDLGQFALNKQGSLTQISSKGGQDWVTEVDHAIDAELRKFLTNLFPDSSFISEELEGHKGKSEMTWFVDPLDGTINYMHGLPTWAITASMYMHSKPVFAYCYLPALREIYTAWEGKGAFLNGNQIHVSSIKDSRSAIASMGDYNIGVPQIVPTLNAHNKKMALSLVDSFARVKCLGSAVAESCFVAAGRLDAFGMIYSHPWDIAAGILLVKEAGGMATAPNGSDWDLSDGAALAFSNGHVHAELLNSY